MVGPAHRRKGHSGLAGPVDGCLHGECRANLSHAVAPIDDDRRAPLADDARPPARIDPLDGQFPHVLRNAQRAVRVDAAQVGTDQRSSQ